MYLITQLIVTELQKKWWWVLFTQAESENVNTRNIHRTVRADFMNLLCFIQNVAMHYLRLLEKVVIIQIIEHVILEAYHKAFLVIQNDI